MIYIRNIFKQDLRDGKQIAFTKEPSNFFFGFSYNPADADRQISFTFSEPDLSSEFNKYNGEIIKTRLYAASSESRIDGELKAFLKDSLNAKIDDIVTFRKGRGNTNFSFSFHNKKSSSHTILKGFLGGGNHELLINQKDTVDDQLDEISCSADEIKERFADWFIRYDGQRHNYFSQQFNSDRKKLLDELNKYNDVYNQQFNGSVFDVPFDTIDDFIGELDNNLYANEGEFYSFSKDNSNHKPRAILGKKNYLRFLKEFFNKKKLSNRISPLNSPANKIYFGAPGTGKSWRVSQNLKDVDSIFKKRVTFHPEYDHASFVGSYKPITVNDEIKYKFVPQIFTNIYVEAYNDPDHQYYLIIEELNRGNCAEIFGDLFQLLDRNPDYEISPSNELSEYLKGALDDLEKGLKDGKLLLPDNLSIIATMNTSDQSLFPMDSAFKRRWDWEYIPIDYSRNKNENPSANFVVELTKEDEFNWLDFIESVNKLIKGNDNLGMDKCLGNYFIKPDINENTISLKSFINKAIFYLWNDVFKDEMEDESIFKNKTSYEDFFPIDKKGVEKVTEVLKILKPVNDSSEE